MKNNRPLKFSADIHVKLTEPQRQWLEGYCRMRGLTFSEFVRDAIRRQRELLERER